MNPSMRPNQAPAARPRAIGFASPARQVLALSCCAALAACGGGLDGLTPEITAHPQSVTATPGSTVTFNVTVKSELPFAYQWQRNGNPIPGASNGSYTLVATLADNGANFAVQVTSAGGFALSRNATLTIATAGSGQ